jgi:TonB-linked SusC/RagA family outer membrane protein
MKGKMLLFGFVYLMCMSISFMAHSQTISGTVKDVGTNEPLPGVNIMVKGTTQGAATNAEGKYSLKVPSLQDTLVFSYIGYDQQTVPVNGRTTINIQMESSVVSGQQMVVTGYMKQKKADLTGSITVVPTKELNKNHGTTNIMKSLQGEIPGLQVSTNGSPAGDVSLQIRGVSSFNGVHPLIVIDGVPNYNMNLRDMNANNIASIQVLKGAEAASIYGSQASGGVILIETKKGQPGKVQVSYHGSGGFAKVMNPVTLLNTQQYGRALWRASVNDGLDPNDVTSIYTYDWNKNFQHPSLNKVTPREWLNKTNAKEPGAMQAANTNWLGAILRPGIQNNQQINISGGTEKVTTFLSLNYYKNGGTQIYTKYKRFTLRVNTSYHAINNHLTVGENLSASHMLINDANFMHDAMVEPPIIPVHSIDGGWGGTAVGLGMGDYWNPVRELTLNKGNGNKYNKLFGNLYAQVSFLDHFTVKSTLGLYYTQGYHRNISFKFQEAGGKLQNFNAVDQWFWNDVTLVLSNTLDYKASVGKHNIDFLLGTEVNKHTTQTMDGNRQDLLFQNYNYAYLNTATGKVALSGSGGDSRLLSFFSKVNYNYNSKYLFSADVRYDGSSKFGQNHRYGVFPAASVGWRLSKENFLKNNPVISNLKLRAGWGKTGNSQIPAGATTTNFGSGYDQTAYAISGQKTGQLPSGYYRMQVGNPNLEWETTTSTDIGLDFGLLKQKFTGSLDWYHKDTHGMLFNPPYLGTLGEGANMWINAADMTNQGIEAVLEFKDHAGRNFHYSIRGNVAHNHNQVNSLPQNVRYSYGGSALKGDDIIGHPLHSTYGFVVQGIYQNQKEVDNSPTQPGKGVGFLRYKDISGPNGKPDGVVDDQYDRTWIGSSDPTITYGLNFSANYRNFDFSMFWQGIAGNIVYDGWKTYSDFWNVWVQNGFNHPKRILKAWNPTTNKNSSIPRLSLKNPDDELRSSDYFMEPGGYLKLRNIELGYSLPAGIMSELGIQKIHIYVMVENLVNIKNPGFTGPDPETPTGGAYDNPYVRPQTFKLGLDVKF